MPNKFILLSLFLKNDFLPLIGTSFVEHHYGYGVFKLQWKWKVGFEYDI